MFSARDLLLVLLGSVVSGLVRNLPLDYSVVGGRFVAQYLVFPLLFGVSKLVAWYRMTPVDRVNQIEKLRGIWERAAYGLRVAAAGLLTVGPMLYILVVTALIPEPMRSGQGLLPAVAVSRPELVLILPLPEKLPPPDKTERKLPPRRRVLESKDLPLESMLSQLPIAPRVEYEQAPLEQEPEPRVPPPPVSLRIVAQ